jgi:hypothetical protein
MAAGSSVAPASDDKEAAATKANRIKEGYRVVLRNDQVFYCRSEMITGTQFKKQVCLTEDQLENMEEQNKVWRERMNGAPGVGRQCMPNPNCT